MTVRDRQSGATLVVSLIILVMITLIVAVALIISNSSLKSVGNMQFRNEAIAAANTAIEQMISSSFTESPKTENIDIDINNDGKRDYLVSIAKPTCIRATQAESAAPSSMSLPASMSSSATWNTVWDIDASVSAIDNPGAAAVHIRSGVRVLLSQSQKDLVCP